MIQDLALLDQTDITARTPLGSVTVSISRHDEGYTCRLRSGDTVLAEGSFGTGANIIKKATVIGPLLVQAKNHLSATPERYPDGLDVLVRVEHQGNVHEIPARLPLDANQIGQFSALIGWVRKVNDELLRRG